MFRKEDIFGHAYDAVWAYAYENNHVRGFKLVEEMSYEATNGGTLHGIV